MEIIFYLTQHVFPPTKLFVFPYIVPGFIFGASCYFLVNIFHNFKCLDTNFLL